jgi:hypothetical protein
MTTTEILALLAMATGGLAAGFTIDRSIVALPAWRRLGAEPWAAFSRLADLGRGLALYPSVGVATWLLSMATAVSFAIGDGPSNAGTAVYIAAAWSVAPAMATFRAAPNMLRLRRTDDDDELAAALIGFTRWNHVRAVAQTLGFGANIWALTALLIHAA